MKYFFVMKLKANVVKTHMNNLKAYSCFGPQNGGPSSVQEYNCEKQENDT